MTQVHSVFEMLYLFNQNGKIENVQKTSIRPRHHTGIPLTKLTQTLVLSYLQYFATDRVENTATHCCISLVAVGTFLFAKPLRNGCHIFVYSAVVA
jgi:hypothetical protein